MTKKKENTQTQNGNGNGNEYGLRDFSHLPRAKDLPKPKKLTPQQKAEKKAFREFMKALQEEQIKYGTTFT